MTFGRRLKEFTAHENISVADLALSIKASAAAFYNYQADKILPKIDVVQRISDLYPNISVNWLVTGKGPMLMTQQDISQVQDEAARYERATNPRVIELDLRLCQMEVQYLKSQVTDKEALIQALRDQVNSFKNQ